MAFVPDLSHTRDLRKVRAMCARLENPYWMPDPKSWIWRRPDGAPQGFGLIAMNTARLVGSHGVANLLWLSMDMLAPPLEYDTTKNGLYSRLLVGAYGAQLAGEPLVEVAALLPLAEFAALLPEKTDSSQVVEQTYPLLKLLAGRVLSC